MFSFKRRTAVAIAAGSLGLAAFGSSNTGLFAGLFDKGKCELPKRQPGGDCSFGYHRTVWRPWGTCCETSIPEFSGGTRYVPLGTYSPLNAAPYATQPNLHGEPPIVVGPSPAGNVLRDAGPSAVPEYSQQLPPILTEPGYASPGSSAGERHGEAQIPLPTRPDVRSIESPPVPTPSDQPFQPPQPPRRSSDEPIRGLRPDPTYSQPRSALPRGIRPPAVAQPPATSPPTTDYSEYIPLPTAEPVPQSLPLPNPAARSGLNAEPRPAQQPVQSAAPKSGPTFTDEAPPVAEPASSVPPADNSFNPNGLPLPEPGTRPDLIESIEPGVSRYMPHSDNDRFRDYRPLQSNVKSPSHSPSRYVGFEELPPAGDITRNVIAPASAKRFSGSLLRPEFDRSVQTAISSDHRSEPSTVDEIPEWKPMGNSVRTSRSVAPQPGPGWRTLQTPTGKSATKATSRQHDRSSSLSPPPWRSSRSVQPAAPSRRNSAQLEQTGTLPSVEDLLSGLQAGDSRPARVVQETLYDVVEVDRFSRRASQNDAFALSNGQRGAGRLAQAVPSHASDSQWQPIHAAGGQQQSTATSDGFPPR
jgi:hypothetical protein